MNRRKLGERIVLAALVVGAATGVVSSGLVLIWVSVTVVRALGLA
jgi:hypothetical protein